MASLTPSSPIEAPRRRWAVRPSVAHPLVFLGTIVAGILVPTVVITIQAFLTRDAARISAFASAVAEPLALTGSAGVVALWPQLVSRRSSLLLGVTGALGVLAAALWVNDVDRWTALAVALLPLLRILRHRATSNPQGPRASHTAAADHEVPPLSPGMPPAWRPMPDEERRRQG
jgi:hypothetical protein